MIVLPMPCSGGVHLRHNLVCKASAISARRNLGRVATSAATSTAAPTYQPKSFFEIKINNPLQNDNTLTVISEPKPRSKKESRGGLEKDVASIIQRLEAFGERVIELERQKFMNKMKGSELSDEESIMVQDLSREIVSKFLDKPIQFLTSSDGDLEDKLKELNFLVRILEESCFTKEKVPSIISCPR